MKSHNAFIRRKIAFAAAAKKKAKPSENNAGSPPNDFVLTDEYKSIIREHGHLGKKGYTIPKEYLHPDDLAFLYKDLFVKPEVKS